MISVEKLPRSLFIEFLNQFESEMSINKDSMLEFVSKKLGRVSIERSHLEVIRTDDEKVGFIRHYNNYIFMNNSVDDKYRVVRVSGTDKEYKQDISSEFNNFVFNTNNAKSQEDEQHEI